MKKNLLSFFFLFLLAFAMQAQTNILSTNSTAAQVLLGNYDPLVYKATTILNHPDSISRGINKEVSPDSLKSYMLTLSTFKNRNTGADTVSETTGIGAARRWVYSKFQQFSAANESRLLPSYLQFNQTICAATQHKNIFAVLPGLDTTDKRIIIIEGHIDSRCSSVCDTACVAHGMEDNATGTALVIELARVMSKYSFSHTIVFMAVIGEEQGLYGANAFATHAKNTGIQIKGVLNNDVIGGIICGKTSSAPSCPGLNHIDSTQVRLFSYGGFNSFNKGLARFVKLEYKEQLLPVVKVPMTVSIMSAEDRTGRGGDHIPFRQKGFAAIRFTSANEHGDASNSTGYTDRQHTTGDILGVDTDGDMLIDSFFVDFNYLSRNAVINGNAAGLMAIGPKTPDFTASSLSETKLRVEITQQTQYMKYRVGVRTTTNDWDSVYTISGSLVDTLNVSAASTYYVSVASVDTNGIESLFSKELSVTATITGINGPEQPTVKKVELMQNKPNPADEATIISVMVNDLLSYKSAYIQVRDLKGKEVIRLPLELKNGMNEVLYDHGYNASGTYVYSLVIDGKVVQSNRMVFTN